MKPQDYSTFVKPHLYYRVREARRKNNSRLFGIALLIVVLYFIVRIIL